MLTGACSSISMCSTSVNSTPRPCARGLLARKYIRARPSAAICWSCCSVAPCSRAVNSRSAYSGGRAWVMSRLQASSVVPGFHGEPEPCARADDQALGGGRLPPRLRPHLRLPPLLDLTLCAAAQVLAAPLELARDVPFHRAPGDPERLCGGVGALELLDQILHLRLGAPRDAAGERPLQRAVRAVPERVHHGLLPFSGALAGLAQVRVTSVLPDGGDLLLVLLSHQVSRGFRLSSMAFPHAASPCWASSEFQVWSEVRPTGGAGAGGTTAGSHSGPQLRVSARPPRLRPASCPARIGRGLPSAGPVAGLS